jgi:hypothetical protein
MVPMRGARRAICWQLYPSMNLINISNYHDLIPQSLYSEAKQLSPLRLPVLDYVPSGFALHVHFLEVILHPACSNDDFAAPP